MARSADQIAADIARRMHDTDPGVDTNKGPFYDFAIVPPANELAVVEAEVEKVLTLYSRLADKPGSLVEGEIAALGRSFKVPTPQGARAKVLATFYLTSIPAKEINIPAGFPVASDDGAFVFTTTSAVRGLTAEIAATYLDPSTGRYLINVEAVAAGTGAGYNLPAYRITRMLMQATGIAGVYNPVAASGGTSPDQSLSYLQEIQNNFAARDTSTNQGVLTELRRRGADAALTIVDSTNRAAFFRPVKSSAADVYTPSPAPEAAEDLFVANSTGLYALTKKPVLAVDAVYINGVLQPASAYVFAPDMTPAYRRSARAADIVRVKASVSAGDNIRIRYRYSGSVWALEQSLSDADIMGVDILPRLTNPLNMVVVADVLCPVSALAEIRASAQSYMVNNLISSHRSRDLSEYLHASHAELQLIRFSVFARKGRNVIETVEVPTGFSVTFLETADLQFRVVSV